MSGGAVSGAAVFSAHCAACHQASGQGLTGTFPPLAGSRWVESEDYRLSVAIVLVGLQGEIKVRGTRYKGIMPAFGDQLTDAQIAAVISYVRGAWGNSASGISVEDVATVRDRIGKRDAWQGADELTATFVKP